MPRSRCVIALSIALLPLATVAQTTVTLQQGASYSGAADNWIICCDGAATNRGADVEVDMRSTSDYGLFHFNVFQSEGGPVPNGATINSATLSLYKSFGVDVVMRAQRVTKPWSETGSTWNSTGTVLWAAPGGDVLGTADGQGSAPDSAANNC